MERICFIPARSDRKEKGKDGGTMGKEQRCASGKCFLRTVPFFNPTKINKWFERTKGSRSLREKRGKEGDKTEDKEEKGKKEKTDH